MKKIILVVVAVVLVAGVFGLNRIRQPESGQSLLHVAPAPTLAVLVTQPERQAITRIVQAPGEIEAVLEVEIRSEIPAKIEEMPVEEGNLVDAGQLLCRLNDDAFRALVESGEASLKRLEASIRQAEAQAIQCRYECQRRERLAQADAASDHELADYRTQLLVAEADVEVRRQTLAEAQAMLRQARDNLAKTVINSPINGVVSQIHAKPGEVVVTGTMNNPGTVIMVVTDLSQMQVRTRVDETDVPLVKPDHQADIFLPSDPQRAIPGRVLRVATSGTKQAGRDVVTFETLVLVDSDDPRVRPGMTANVEIRVARKDDTLTVPVQAIVHRKRNDLPAALVKQFDEQQAEAGLDELRHKAQYLKVVYCKQNDVAHPRLVQTGIANESRVELLAGLTEDDQIIIGPYRSLDQLKDGSKVELDKSKEAEATETKAEPDTAKLAGDTGTEKDDHQESETVAQAQ